MAYLFCFTAGIDEASNDLWVAGSSGGLMLNFHAAVDMAPGANVLKMGNHLRSCCLTHLI